MRRFVSGLVMGMILGTAVTAYAAGIHGNGYLMGWSVTKDGEEVCSDPMVSTLSKEIECD